MKTLEKEIASYIPRLRRYARALLRGDALAADDLVQDCLERALARLHHWRAGSDLRAWLFTIMHNLYVNFLRAQDRRPEFVEFDEEASLPGAGLAERGVVLRDLHRALIGLSPDQREILLLVTLEGLRYEEVARILDIPVGTVMSRLARARQQLREGLAAGSTSHVRRVK